MNPSFSVLLRPLHRIFGPESSGKTTLALHAIAEVQKRGGAACFIDAEHAFDKAYAQVGTWGAREAYGRWLHGKHARHMGGGHI